MPSSRVPTWVVAVTTGARGAAAFWEEDIEGAELAASKTEENVVRGMAKANAYVWVHDAAANAPVTAEDPADPAEAGG